MSSHIVCFRAEIRKMTIETPILTGALPKMLELFFQIHTHLFATRYLQFIGTSAIKSNLDTSIRYVNACDKSARLLLVVLCFCVYIRTLLFSGLITALDAGRSFEIQDLPSLKTRTPASRFKTSVQPDLGPHALFANSITIIFVCSYSLIMYLSALLFALRRF